MFTTNRVLGNIYSSNTYIGIGITIPRKELDIIGNTIVTGDVGIGTTLPRKPLDVTGDINFTGDLYKNNSLYVSSQWTTNNTNIYITGSNVGIGTTLPQGQLHIYKEQYYTPWAEQTRIQASDASSSDNFGQYAVSINGDGTTMAIGSYYDDNSGGIDAGSVYVFTRTLGGSWTQQTRLQASDASDYDCFGISLSINNAGTVIAIGSIFDNNSGGTTAGSVYIFTRTAGGSWDQQTRLQASDATNNERFGFTVSISNDDQTLAIANIREHIYIFTRTSNGIWNQQTKLTGNDTVSGDYFGSSIAVNDGGTILAISAPLNDNSTGTDGGAVYIFTRTSAGSWSQQAKIITSDVPYYAGVYGNQFGYSIDINSDGTVLASTAIYDANAAGEYAGALYVFTRTTGGNWYQQTKLVGSDTISQDGIGNNVSINNTGTVIALGAHYDDNSGGVNAGSVYVFTRTIGGSWSEQTRLQASDALSNDYFGDVVAMNNDGTTLVISAPYDDNSGGTDAGSVYVFSRSIFNDKTILITDNNGNIGIGTALPKASLDVYAKNILVGQNTAYATYQSFASNVVPPSADGMINGVNITALNKRTRASYADALNCVSTWTTRTSAADNSWFGICWAAELGLFCAVSGNGSGNRVMTSPDGINWTSQTSAADNEWINVCWSPELRLLCAVAATGSGNRVMTSPDGINWTSQTSATDNVWNSICWSAELGIFCAVAGSGSGNRVMTSEDGINWTSQTSAADEEWTSICWSAELGLFCAVAFTGTIGSVMTSPDGINWTQQTAASSNYWNTVCWSAELGLFCAVSDTGSGNRVMTSPDGINWTSQTSAADNGWWTVCWSPQLSLFCAVAYDGIDRIMTSPDGIHWTLHTTPINNSWWSICWSPELSIFCSISYDGTGNRVMTSAIGLPASKSTLLVNPSHMIVNQINGNVGIGTSTPRQKLDIIGDSIISGNVGIGTSTPRQKLDIIGEFIISGNVGIGTILPKALLDIYKDDTWKEQSRLQASDSASCDKFGYIISINSDATTLAIGAPYDNNLGGTDAGSVYIYTRTAGGSWSEQTRLQASDGGNNDNFGYSISINSDGTTLAVGSLYDDTSAGINAGSVYVFTRTLGGLWTEQTRLEASDGTANDEFGKSVSINDDGTVIAIGAQTDDNSGGTNAGSVYVFTRTSGGSWEEQTRLQASDASSNNLFGNAVSINNDGTTLAIGSAYYSNDNITYAGSVYIFTRTIGGTWAEQTRLKANHGVFYDTFGYSISINSDGTSVAIGAYQDNSVSYNDSGSVYLFTRTIGGSWTLQTRLEADDTTDNQKFGKSVSINNNGTVLAVGTPYMNTGYVYIFSRSINGDWNKEVRLQGSDPINDDYFGWSVDINSDGSVLAISDYKHDNSGGTDAGSVYVFNKNVNNTDLFRINGSMPFIITSSGNIGIGTSIPMQKIDIIGDTSILGNVGIGTILPNSILQVCGKSITTLWDMQTRLQASDAATNGDLFGNAVSINSDGTVIAIGAYYKDNSGGFGAGNVYVFTRTSGGSWTEQARLQASDAATSDSFGSSVSINSDGTTLAIGSMYDNNSSGAYAGSVYIFTRTANGSWSELTRLQASDGAANDSFGNKVNINSNGTVLAIGAKYDDNSGGINAGSVYIFTRSNNTWGEQTRLQASDAAANDYFGNSVSLNSDGTTLAVGSWYDDNSGGTNAGSAYIFTQIGGVWSEQTRLQASDTSSCDSFGASVSIDSNGTTLAIGSVYDSNSGGLYAGSVYIFTRTSGGSWNQQIRLQASDANTADSFGLSVSINNDGTTLAIGSPYNDHGGKWSGSVYIFTRNIGETWNQQIRIQGDIATLCDYFGNSVSINSDGTTIAVGAWYDDIIYNNDNAGSVYVFTRSVNKPDLLYINDTNGAPTIIVKSDGNIGIGTVTPSQKLHIIGNEIISGNVGIGTTMPITALHVQGIAYASANIGIGITNPTYQLELSLDSAAKPTSSSWTVSSDRRIKEDIQNADLDRCYDVVKDLRLCRFKWNSNYMPQVSDQHMLGWIAQEVEPFIPNAITRRANYGFPDLLGLDSDQIIKFMYGAIQKNIKTIEEQQNEINKLKDFIASKFDDYSV